jgi:D-sedoheptulose 7-phosphate isomerase
MPLDKSGILNEVALRVQEARRLLNNDASFNFNRIMELSAEILKGIQSGKRLAFVGNGGSAAEAMHLAAEFTGKCVIDHRPLPVMCLNESQSALTAIANDYGIEHMFSRQVDAHLREGDFLIALSTSGKSKNILNALDLGVSRGVRSILWMGDFDFHIPGVETWKVPSKQTPRIQEIHLLWGHILSEIIEILLFQVD